jgi:hypothetical protein
VQKIILGTDGAETTVTMIGHPTVGLLLLIRHGSGLPQILAASVSLET